MIRFFLVCLTLCATLTVSLGYGAEMVRLRIIWGGKNTKAFGEIAVSSGFMSQLTPIVMDSENPGGAWVVNGVVQVRQAVEKSFHGFDVTIPYDKKGMLRFRLADNPQYQNLAWVELPLETVVREGKSASWGPEGALGFSAKRVGGDNLRVNLEKDNVVYAPGDVFRATISPALLDGTSGNADLDYVLYRGRETFDVQRGKKPGISLAPGASTQIEFPVPEEEGVYDLVLTLTRNRMEGRLMEPLSRPLTSGPLSGTKLDPKTVVAERHVQILVVSRETPGAEIVRNSSGNRCVVEIDPTNTNWWESMDSSVQRMFRQRGGEPWALGSGHGKARQALDGPMFELQASGDPNIPAWEAYPFAVERVGMPHILEVEYPAGQEQTLGISILEPNVTGAIAPLGVDSGINVPQSTLENPVAGRERYRLVFWPKSRTPIIMMTNRNSNRPAFYGKIRILALDGNLPKLEIPQLDTPPQSTAPRRTIAALFTRPVFPETFSASEVNSGTQNITLDDWQTFYDGARRMFQYLGYTGYNGLVLNVYSDGSTIYPSRVLQPTSRYDNGVYFASGQDPVRKDVLEMLFRMSDREHVRMIPSMDFSSPIPMLEIAGRFPEVFRDSSGRSMLPSGRIQWHDYQGRELVSSLSSLKSGAQYYNVLNPYVQDTILLALKEVIERYGHHPSFGGISLQLHRNSMLVLPSVQWGMDAASVELFGQETGTTLPTDFTQRVRMLSTGDGARAWMAWRATKLTQFYQRASALLNNHANARLYLVGDELFDAEKNPELGTNLSVQTSAQDVLLRLGLNTTQLSQIPNLVFPRPQRIQSNTPLSEQVTDLQWGQTPGTYRIFQTQRTPSGVFYHSTREIGVKEFDEKSPFKPTLTWLVATFAQDDTASRRRYAEGVGMLDPEILIDGGLTPSFGKEETLRETFRILRQLPAGRFHSAMMSTVGDRRSQPILFRSYPENGTNYACAINMTPFPMEGIVYVQPSVNYTTQQPNAFSTSAIRLSNDMPLVLQQNARGVFWRVSLAPYQIEAIRFSGSPVVLVDPVSTFSATVRDSLVKEFENLQRRLAGLKSPPFYVGLKNAGFESLPDGSGDVSQWTVSRPRATTPAGLKAADDSESGNAFAQIDPRDTVRGNASLHLFSTGTPIRMMSQPFRTSSTGRLSVFVWMKTSEIDRSVPVRFILEANSGETKFYRTANLMNLPQKIGHQWQQLTINVTDLPLRSDLDVRIGFELFAAGSVWIDEIQLSDMTFSDSEQEALSGIFSSFQQRIQTNDIAPCVSILDCFWMRFLKENVSFATPPVTPPLVAPELASVGTPPRTPALVTPPPTQETVPQKPKKKGFVDSVKGFMSNVKENL